VQVTDNHFVSDFFNLHKESSGFEIPAELSFQDGEFGFHDLSFSVSWIISSAEHFLPVISANDFIVPRARRDN
jgi:hypothetical protein